MHISTASTLIGAIRTNTRWTDSDAIPQTLQKAWAVFIYCSFIFSPTSLLFLTIQKENMYMSVYRCMQHPPQQTLRKPGPLYFVFLFEDELSYGFSDAQKGSRLFPQWGITQAVNFYLAPAISRMPKRASLSPSSLSSGWNQPADTKAAAEKGKKQAGRAGHTCLHAHREAAWPHALFL